MSKKKTVTLPTPEQVAAEVAKLEEMKPYVRARSGFGDDHHAAIDAQCAVLRERMDEDDIYSNYSPGGEDEETGVGTNVLEAALDARRWLDGEALEEGTVLSDGWKSLDRRNN